MDLCCHDTSLFSKLVLGCIDSYDSEKWRIFSDFSRSARFSQFRTALNVEFQQISLTFSRNFNKICKISGNSQDFDKNDELSRNFEFRAVRTCENRVDLEKYEKMRHFSLS